MSPLNTTYLLPSGDFNLATCSVPWFKATHFCLVSCLQSKNNDHRPTPMTTSVPPTSQAETYPLPQKIQDLIPLSMPQSNFSTWSYTTSTTTHSKSKHSLHCHDPTTVLSSIPWIPHHHPCTILCDLTTSNHLTLPTLLQNTQTKHYRPNAYPTTYSSVHLQEPLSHPLLFTIAWMFPCLSTKAYLPALATKFKVIWHSYFYHTEHPLPTTSANMMVTKEIGYT